MSDAAAVERILRDEIGLSVESIRRTAGGDINDAFRAHTDSGDVFVKTSMSALPGVFEDEAAGLEWLAEPEALSTPDVIGVHDPPGDGPRLLALRWIERGSLASEEELGRGLAAIHAAGAPAFGATPSRGGGYAHNPMRFNELALPNEPCDTWAEFYARRRIVPLVKATVAKGALPNGARGIMERLCDQLPSLAGPAEPPARTHGDLWSGNVMPGEDGRAYLIDPVAHGGHREVDLALLRLFGGPGERCFDAYAEAFPLSDGHEERRVLWQIAMILLHAYLLGGGYGAQAVAMARRYV